MKTSTILPFFKWRTNGTTKVLPKTASPGLYHVVGTLSPPPGSSEEISTTTDDTETDSVETTELPSSVATTVVENVSDAGNSTGNLTGTTTA
ncbi:unnamed protein product [Danaus chrysippus]|uniref:(African queen) hypothetical protein n=1 Tax=Danaus chrysippus TaxID=151541 RepID=A0A8J2QPX0_9NEOP|nr:unnamed protein product [Danaus chrysippus]